MGLGMMKTTRKSTTAFLLVHILIILLLEPSKICAAEQVLTLYSEDGRSLTINGRNSPDLRDLDFDDTAKSAQAQGLWIVYSSYNYHGAFQLVQDTYKELNYDLKRKASSARLVGSSDNGLESTLTLYQGINFQGREFYNFGDNSNLDGSASSLIVTGNEQWTIFDTSNFGGDSICISPSIVYDTTNLKISSIRSLRRGCYK